MDFTVIVYSDVNNRSELNALSYSLRRDREIMSGLTI